MLVLKSEVQTANPVFTHNENFTTCYFSFQVSKRFNELAKRMELVSSVKISGARQRPGFSTFLERHGSQLRGFTFQLPFAYGGKNGSKDLFSQVCEQAPNLQNLGLVPEKYQYGSDSFYKKHLDDQQSDCEAVTMLLLDGDLLPNLKELNLNLGVPPFHLALLCGSR